MEFKDKFECYDYYRDLLEFNKVKVDPYMEINYGLQFGIAVSGLSSTIRIYESKTKGVRVDLSLVKNSSTIEFLSNIGVCGINSQKKALSSAVKRNTAQGGRADIDQNRVIGTDESGKGDYFGPLVIAGVFADKETKNLLREIGVDDSKKLRDSKISSMAEKIKSVCEYDIVVIENSRYNELYFEINNLNKLLASGHAQVIENMLGKVDCDIVLSDQFGSPELIESALMEKGKHVDLEQRPRAEENIVVAAASILARNEFVERMDQMSRRYEIEFPKGASSKIVVKGKDFVSKYGKDRLCEVAKLHFKTTSSI